jgi:hypothetical protein
VEKRSYLRLALMLPRLIDRMNWPSSALKSAIRQILRLPKCCTITNHRRVGEWSLGIQYRNLSNSVMAKRHYQRNQANSLPTTAGSANNSDASSVRHHYFDFISLDCEGCLSIGFGLRLVFFEWSPTGTINERIWAPDHCCTLMAMSTWDILMEEVR